MQRESDTQSGTVVVRNPSDDEDRHILRIIKRESKLSSKERTPDIFLMMDIAKESPLVTETLCMRFTVCIVHFDDYTCKAWDLFIDYDNSSYRAPLKTRIRGYGYILASWELLWGDHIETF
jgi:hypothetical protein